MKTPRRQTLKKRILVLAPHTDDGEFGCGGSVARFVEEGHAVHYVAFSAAEKSVASELPPGILRKEVVEATKVLGIPRENLETLSFEVRTFPAHRQDILEIMVKLDAQLKPDIVFLPSTADTHQDHQTISREGFRAFKKTTLLGYELPWNNLTFTTNAFIMLSDEHVACKVEALLKYESQSGRSYATPEFVRSLASVRGVQIGTDYAEVFEVIRWIMR
jgi:LmbE family N-acetylglucosaminyl deacetylase